MHDNDDWRPGGGRAGQVVAAVVIALVVIFLLLHVTGVLSAGSH
jgi:hypothetical protein